MSNEESANAMPRDDETVYVRPRSRGNSITLHTDPGCSRIQPADVIERKRSLYPTDTHICEWCRGDASQPTNDGIDTKETRKTLLSMDPDDLGLSSIGDRGEP